MKSQVRMYSFTYSNLNYLNLYSNTDTQISTLFAQIQIRVEYTHTHLLSDAFQTSY